jgi:hypothetical protein
MVQTRYTNRLREAPRLKNTQSQKPAETPKLKKPKYSYISEKTKIRSWVRIYPETPVKTEKAGQKRQRRNSESALKTKLKKSKSVNSDNSTVKFKPVRVITDPKTPRKQNSSKSIPVRKTNRGRSPVKKEQKVPTTNIAKKTKWQKSKSSTSPLRIQSPVLSPIRASSIISSESENDSVFETSFTRGGFDLATNRWSFSPNPQPAKTILRDNSRHIIEDEEKSLRLALSKSNKSFQNSLNKMKKRRNRSLGQLFARTAASQPTIDDNSSFNSDDFDNDDIQGLRKRSKSCGQICPTPRQVSDQESSNVTSHIQTNSQKSSIFDKSIKTTKLMRKEKTLLLLKKNRQVFADREEPDFDSMNSFRPNKAILRRASEKDRHSQEVLTDIFKIHENFK